MFRQYYLRWGSLCVYFLSVVECLAVYLVGCRLLSGMELSHMAESSVKVFRAVDYSCYPSIEGIWVILIEIVLLVLCGSIICRIVWAMFVSP